LQPDKEKAPAETGASHFVATSGASRAPQTACLKYRSTSSPSEAAIAANVAKLPELLRKT
jgi:hypothetical protein